MLRANPLATYTDLAALPEGERAEILAGQIVVPPAPLPRHQKAQGAVRRFIGGPFDDDDGHGGPGGWWILTDVDVRLAPHDIVRPDLSGWRRERLPDVADLRPIDVVPDWICEVLSPSNAAQDRIRKRHLYARAGVAYYWLLDPVLHTLEAHALDAGTWRDAGSYDADATDARVPPFDAVPIDVGRLFLPRHGDR